MHFDSTFKIQLHLPIIITRCIFLIRHTGQAARRGGGKKKYKSFSDLHGHYYYYTLTGFLCLKHRALYRRKTVHGMLTAEIHPYSVGLVGK